MSTWEKYNARTLRHEDLGFSIDTSRMDTAEGFFESLKPQIQRAFSDMRELEAGAIANPDEGRQVGHYWLRNSALAPAEHQSWIESVKTQVAEFSAKIHAGEICAANGNTFRQVLVIGIGGSALGPQLVADALMSVEAPLGLHFLDNTDPGGIDDVFREIGDGIAETLVIVTSKSGGTAETRNGMLEAEAKFAAAGIPFEKQAVAVTGKGSKLDNYASENGWITRFEMSDWIGGRTSVMSAVGLLPAALVGIDTNQFLAGAAAMDELTRVENVEENAAMLLALMWHHAGDGKGKKDMVIVPYCDRLELMSKYLQQLVMESLGKEHDLDGNIVNQGIAVYGNKGSTDQHAYIQQLRDGLNNFFVTFIEVGQTRTSGDSISVEENGAKTADFLQGFLRGTRSALYASGRESITLSFTNLNAFTVGSLIALYERAVSFYASLVNINAYHQPGVEAGKVAAGSFLEIIDKVREHIASSSEAATAETIAAAIGETEIESVYHALTHLAANSGCIRTAGASPAEDQFGRV